ncbi:MAG: hypothetical protein OSB70_07855 [Myxococcota bacterium]|nr:hypothetical protein [Myxococcota bacterium]
MKMELWIAPWLLVLGLAVGCGESDSTAVPRAEAQQAADAEASPEQEKAAALGEAPPSHPQAGPAREGAAGLPREQIKLAPSGEAERKAYDEAKSRAKRAFDASR